MKLWKIATTKAVSYTHLDVYKRQVSLNMDKVNYMNNVAVSLDAILELT